MIPSCFLILILGVLASHGLPEDYAVVGPGSTTYREAEENPQQCAQDLIKWCKNQQFPPGNFISTSSFNSHIGSRVSCTVDSNNGEVCLKNGITWFRCFPNNTFVYKGTVLNDENNEGDDEICSAKGFSNEFVNTGETGKFNQAAFESEMEEFYERMREFQKNMEEMSRNLANTKY